MNSSPRPSSRLPWVRRDSSWSQRSSTQKSWRGESNVFTSNSSKEKMHYVVLRDDDTNALTPIECLERLYRPFLDRGLAVNLATIPNVCTDVRYGEGILEGFLMTKNGATQ